MRLFCFLVMTLTLAKICNSQVKLNDLPYNLNAINKTDDKGKQGTWCIYNRLDSIVFATETYKNDTLDGPFERYWIFNKNISEKCNYKNGKLHGKFLSFWENGTLRIEATYNQGIIDGLFINYNRNGEIQIKRFYKMGINDTTFTESYTDSSVIFDRGYLVKVDTIKSENEFDWNKTLAIYHNDSLNKELIFFKNKLRIENLYQNSILYKRNIYKLKPPYKIEKVFHYKDGKLVKTEFFD